MPVLVYMCVFVCISVYVCISAYVCLCVLVYSYTVCVCLCVCFLGYIQLVLQPAPVYLKYYKQLLLDNTLKMCYLGFLVAIVHIFNSDFIITKVSNVPVYPRHQYKILQKPF